MRVLILNYEYPPVGGGAGVATAQLARRLALRGYRVHVVAARPERRGPSRSRVDVPGASGSLTLHRVWTRRNGPHDAGVGGAASYLARALPLLWRLRRRRRFDLVHAFFSLPTGAVLPAAGFGPLPLIVSLRGSDVPGYDPARSGLQLAHRLLGPFNRWVWRRADRVVALSAALGELARRTDPGLAYRVIHNGVDLELFRPAADGRPPRPGLPVRCLAVARLIPRKRLRDLVLAWAALERGRYRLEIVGSGPEEAALRRLIDDRGLGGDVRLLGRLSRERLAARYRASDLFTLVPESESFGNVFAEALASGLPVVGAAVGGIPEYVSDGRNGVLLPPGRPAAIADAVRRLGRDPGRRAEIGRRNRLDAERTLSWDAVADSYVEVYREAAAERAARAEAPGAAAPGADEAMRPGRKAVARGPGGGG